MALGAPNVDNVVLVDTVYSTCLRLKPAQGYCIQEPGVYTATPAGTAQQLAAAACDDGRLAAAKPRIAAVADLPQIAVDMSGCRIGD